MDYKKLAQSILTDIGGKDNIDQGWHCATRLRFYLKDDSKAQTKKIEDLDGVITVVNSAGQYQVVIGNSVGKVYDALVDITGPLGESDSEASKEKDTTPKKKGNILNRLIGFLSGSFTPFIGAIAGAGILKGLIIFICCVALDEHN